MDGFDRLQERLPAAWAVNRSGSGDPHVVVMLPSFSLGPTILEHYCTRLGPMEQRYLLAVPALARMPGMEMVFLTCSQPEEAVLDYYARLASPTDPASIRRRLHVVVVPDPSPRGIAAKLLDRPDLVARVRDIVDGRPAMMEPWNVTEVEVAAALALDVPVNGTAPVLWPLAFKSAGRRLIREAGVPVPCGRESVHDPREIAAAVVGMRAERPGLDRVVVKQDNSGAGDGNWILPTRDAAGRPRPEEWLARHCLDEAPDWFVPDLVDGGVVEELVAGDVVSSPSAQLELTPDGEVRLLSTHEQVLGGDNGQVFVGCSFPADPDYAGMLAGHALAVAKTFAGAGARGRIGLDFMAARRGKEWELVALEVNLRKGGTTHPFTALRHLAPGEYDGTGGRWVCDDGTGSRAYRATDCLQEAHWTGLDQASVIEAVEASGLAFDRARGSGVVLHMLGCLPIDGRMGLVAIGHDRAEADRLFEETSAVVHALAG